MIMTTHSKTKNTLKIQKISMLMTGTLLLFILLSIMPKSAFAAPIEWTVYGGNWTITDSVYSVNSTANQQPIEKRLIALSSDFEDFTMEADIHFADNSNHGNAG